MVNTNVMIKNKIKKKKQNKQTKQIKNKGEHKSLINELMKGGLINV